MFLYNPPHTLLHIDVESKKCKAIIPFSGCHYLFSLRPKEKIQLGASTVFLRPVSHKERHTEQVRGAAGARRQEEHCNWLHGCDHCSLYQSWSLTSQAILIKKKEALCTHTERSAFMEWWLGQGLTGQGTRALKIRKQGNMSQWRCYFSHTAQEIFARVNIWLRNNEVQLQDLRRSLTRNSKCHGSDITGG